MFQHAIVYSPLRHVCVKMLLFTALRSLMMPIPYYLLCIPFVLCQCRASNLMMMSPSALGGPKPEGGPAQAEGPGGALRATDLQCQLVFETRRMHGAQARAQLQSAVNNRILAHACFKVL